MVGPEQSRDTLWPRYEKRCTWTFIHTCHLGKWCSTSIDYCRSTGKGGKIKMQVRRIKHGTEAGPQHRHVLCATKTNKRVGPGGCGHGPGSAPMLVTNPPLYVFCCRGQCKCDVYMR